MEKSLVPYLISALLSLHMRIPLPALGISRSDYSFSYLLLLYDYQYDNQYSFYLCSSSHQVIRGNIIHSCLSSRTKSTVEWNTTRRGSCAENTLPSRKWEMLYSHKQNTEIFPVHYLAAHSQDQQLSRLYSLLFLGCADYQ